MAKPDELTLILQRVRPAMAAAAAAEDRFAELRAEHDPDPIRHQLDELSRRPSLVGSDDPVAALTAQVAFEALSADREQLAAELTRRERREQALQDGFKDLRQKLRYQLESQAGQATLDVLQPRLQQLADQIHAALDEVESLSEIEREAQAACGVRIDLGLVPVRSQLALAGWNTEQRTGRMPGRHFGVDSFWQFRERRKRRGAG